MELNWKITGKVIKAYREFIKLNKNHKFVRERIDKNIKRKKVVISQQSFWRALIGCFITTQQKSGEGSKVDIFLKSNNPILNINFCLKETKLKSVVRRELSVNGLRRTGQISEQTVEAIKWLKDHDWVTIRDQLIKLVKNTSSQKERVVARFFKDNFKGLGPKQSRNLIQQLGLSQYEIPIDSRMVKVLKKLSFQLPLSPVLLSDEEYYCFVQDGLRLILDKIKITPCEFDACVFASLEKR